MGDVEAVWGEWRRCFQPAALFLQASTRWRLLPQSHAYYPLSLPSTSLPSILPSLPLILPTLPSFLPSLACILFCPPHLQHTQRVVDLWWAWVGGEVT